VPRRRIKVDAVTVALWERGAGPPVLAILGLLSDGRAMVEALAPLAARFRVIAPDLPGFGRSDKPRGYLCSPEGYAAFAVRLARALEITRPAIVGAGAGAAVAAALVARDPGGAAGAFALREPIAPRALVRRVTSARQLVAARRLVETWVRGRGVRPAAPAPLVGTAALAEALERAFAARAAAGSGETDCVDEGAEQRRAEELERVEQARRRLRVLS
jgi:pimeloyl-ACP methyl ester carboxylesterase